jgi:hypothetical protein
MKRKATIAALLTAGAFAVSASPALAESDEQACTAAGGTYTKTQGVSSCAFPVGNSHNVKTTFQKGSYESSHPEGKINPGGNLPPGQQGGDTLR